uniref:Proteophosphoglycan n=1 Tax=Oryza sativa subsp. japonica TaxID=39947 RepID=Q9FW12_ORYSJ|nr:putative proteophosphoglycan [Oryza sativa Japonica Group]
MDGGTGPGAELLSPGEAEWPPELRLPPPPPPHPPPPPPLEPAPPSTPQLRGEASPPPPPPPPVGPPGAAVVAAAARKEASASAEGFDDSHFLGSIMGAPAHQHQHQHQQPPAVGPPVVVKRKRGRPPKNRDGAAPPPPPKPVKKREDDEDVVCFICFDGGNLVVCDKNLLEDLIDDNGTFSDKITGAFVRIRTPCVGQKQDIYRLVKVLGTHKVAERYSVGKKTTDHALEILNLDKKEVITMDTISNQDFTEGDIHEKAKIFQLLRVNDRSCNFWALLKKEHASLMKIQKYMLTHNHRQNCSATSHHTTTSPPTEGMTHGQGEEGDMEPEKVWHYKDPSGSVQGPFTLLQLSKWAAYFPHQLVLMMSGPLEATLVNGTIVRIVVEGSHWSSTADSITHDGLQLSLASAKPESCSAVNPIRDGDSSSASRVPNQSGAHVYSPPHPATTNLSKSEETMNQCKSCEPEASNKSRKPDASHAPVNQHPKPESDPLLPDTQDFERTHPSPSTEHDTKEPLKDQSRSTSVAPEGSGTMAHGQSSIAFISEASGPLSSKIVGLQPPKDTSFLVEKDIKDGGSITQTEQQKEESTAFKKENVAVDPISDSEAIVSGVLESLTETYNLHEETALENFTPTSAEEEQPQCSTPIALSPWDETSDYQGEAVDSALWGVQDDQNNEMWSLSSPTPTLQPSGIGADTKGASCAIEEVIVAQGNSGVVEPSPALEKKRIEKVPSASIDRGVPEQEC